MLDVLLEGRGSTSGSVAGSLRTSTSRSACPRGASRDYFYEVLDAVRRPSDGAERFSFDGDGV